MWDFLRKINQLVVIKEEENNQNNEPLWFDHLVEAKDAARFKQLYKERENLLKRSKIVIEDLRYNEDNIWP